MVKLNKPAQAGTVESSDILIVVSPAEPGAGITIELTSPTLQQYGEQIRALILKTLQDLGVTDVSIHANEKGALDCTIEARLKTAIARAMGQGEG